MAKRLVNTTTVWNGMKARLEIIDLTGSGLDLNHAVEISTPGIVLSYSGDINDHTRPIMSSSLSFTAFMTSNQRNDVMNVLYSDTEYALACGYYLYDDNGNEHLEWCGMVLPDQTSETIEDGGPFISISFSCTDGFGYLNHANFLYPDTGNFYEGFRTFAWWTREALKKLPYYSYYFSGQAQSFMTEVGLPYPVGDSYGFNDSASVLDSCSVAARTFYGPRQNNNTQRRLAVAESTFSPTYAVLEDIMTAFGATLVLTRGRFWVINKSFLAHNADSLDSVGVINFVNSTEAPYYEVTPNTESLLIDLDENSMHFLVGANRTGVFPYRGATMIHKNAGSDLLFAAGVGYSYGIDSEEPITQQPIYDRVDGFSSEEDIDMYSVGIGNNQPHVSGLSIPSGPDGLITFTAAGWLDFHINLSQLSLAASYYAVGSCPIVRFVIRAVDSTGKEWRLKRHVVTLNDYRVDITTGSFMENLGFVLPFAQQKYYPKHYEFNGSYDWVGDDDPGFGSTYFETMVAQDPSVVVEGTTERFLEVDFLNTKFYTPVKTEVKSNQEQSDNVLGTTQNNDRTSYLWRINTQVQAPTLSSGYISEMHIDGHQLLVYSPGAGPRQYGDGTYTFTTNPQFYTSTDNVTGEYSNSTFRPKEYILYGCTLTAGDGTDTSDLQYVSFDNSNNGSEIKKIGETRVGSSYQNAAISTNGRIWARLFDGSTQLTDEEDNLKWKSKSDASTQYNALLQLNCVEVMHTRYRVRQMVSGSVYLGHYISYNNVIRPYNILKTNHLHSGGVEYLLPTSITRNISDYNLEMLVCGFDRNAVTQDIESKGGRNGVTNGNPDGPGVTDESNDGLSSVGRLIQRVAAAEDKTDLIQVSVPITDDSLGGGGTGTIDELFPLFLGRN